jgi:hypothetical protein
VNFACTESRRRAGKSYRPGPPERLESILAQLRASRAPTRLGQRRAVVVAPTTPGGALPGGASKKRPRVSKDLARPYTLTATLDLVSSKKSPGADLAGRAPMRAPTRGVPVSCRCRVVACCCAGTHIVLCVGLFTTVPKVEFYELRQ